MNYFDYDSLIETINNFTMKLKNGANKMLAPRIMIYGHSELGRPIIILTTKNAKILLQGAIHAREHITAKLLCELAAYYFDNSTAITENGLCFLPMANPDGVEINLHKFKNAKKVYAQIIKMTTAVNDYNELFDPTVEKYKIAEISADTLQQILDSKYSDILAALGDYSIKLWKANANCVDLNLNFDANWGKGVGNVRSRAYKGYIGKYPTSEAETQILAKLTDKYRFEYTLSYHARGNVIYYAFNDIDPNPHFRTIISNLLNAPMLKTPTSAGGYKDYFVDKYKKAGLTIEVGSESGVTDIENPLQYEQLYDEYDNIFNHHKKIINYLSRL